MTDKTYLQRHPHTLLGSEMLGRFFDSSKQEYFFDRDPYLFRYILNFYQCGKLHSSPDDCPVAFKDELDYFGIPICELEDCCWDSAKTEDKEKHPVHYAVRKTSMKPVHTAARTNYIDWKRNEKNCETKTRKDILESIPKKTTHSKKSRNNLPMSRATMDKATKKRGNSVELTGSNHSEESDKTTEVCANRRKCKINCGCGPRKSKLAQQTFNFLYGLFIILSVVTTTVETIDCEKGIKCLVLHSELFSILDATFVAVFTLEFLIRFGLARKRCSFMKDIFNIIDLLAILPYYISLIASQFGDTDSVTLLITLRVLRVSRIMKLTRGSTRLQSLMYTLKNCSTDLLFLYFTFTLGILLFASVLYFVERVDNPANFKSIPHSLWYTCVTMMTTG